MSDRLIFLF